LPFCIDRLGLPFAQRQDNGPMSPMIRVTTLGKPGIVSFRMNDRPAELSRSLIARDMPNVRQEFISQ
jgi:hypothetical protein